MARKETDKARFEKHVQLIMLGTSCTSAEAIGQAWREGPAHFDALVKKLQAFDMTALAVKSAKE